MTIRETTGVALQRETCRPYFKHSYDLIFAANASPNITVDKIFNVTVGQESILTVTTFDPDGDDVSVTLESERPDGSSFHGGVYKWTPTNMEPVNISYVWWNAYEV